MQVVSITIPEVTESPAQMADLLREIARQIEDNNFGYHPTWELDVKVVETKGEAMLRVLRERVAARLVLSVDLDGDNFTFRKIHSTKPEDIIGPFKIEGIED